MKGRPGFLRLLRWMSSALAGCVLLAPVVPAHGQCMQWVRRTDVGQAGPQAGHTMAYNPDRRRVTLFTADEWADLWEYDGRQWLRLFITPGPRPSPRLDSAMTYDRARQELVLVGGFGRNENTELADTWTCRITTDATGNGIGTWTRRPDFPDFALPDPDDASGQKGESGARAEHSLVYDDAARVVRLFGGKARIVRGATYQRPYNQKNYSSGRGAWDGTAWIGRSWSDIVFGPTPDPDEPILPGTMQYRGQLGRKAIAATYDAARQRVVTYGGLRQVYQRYQDGAIWDPDEDDAYVESMPHLQFMSPGASHGFGFPSFSRNLLSSVGGHCGVPLANRVFGSQIVHDTWRDRYVTFGGAYVVGDPVGGVDCSPRYNIQTSDHTSRLVPQAVAFREWDPQHPSPPDRHLNTRIPYALAGEGTHPQAPASRIRHAMVFDEHRGVTVVYGGWDGFNLIPTGMSTETWEYAPSSDNAGFASEPPALTELCLGETLVLQAPPRNPWIDAAYPAGRNRFEWSFDGRPISGATNSTLTLPNVGRDHAGTYTCELTDPCGNLSSTRPAVVRVGGPPVITQQPTSDHVCPGEDAGTLFFFGSDYPATVEWFRLGANDIGEVSLGSLTPVPGATSNEIRFRSMQPSSSGYYRARVTNRCGTVWTGVIALTAGVWLRVEPSSATNEVCSTLNLSAIALGKGPLRYQWRRNGEPLANTPRVLGVDRPGLTFTSVRYLDDAAYDCLVTDACHTVTTRVANITVIPNPPFLLSDTNGPAARQRHALAWDSGRAVTVLFGGLGSGATPEDLYRNDTWEYDGTQWIRRTPAVAPSGRIDFGLAFDRHRGRVVLFGGKTNSPFSGASPNGETWEFDGTNWQQRFPAQAPAARSGHALFFDPVRRVTTLYGGDTLLPNPRAGDLWTWDGTNWTQRIVTGDRPQFGTFGSPPRPRMIWDERRGYAVLPPTTVNLGGSQDRTTWTWDGTNWTPRPYVFTGFGQTPGHAGSGIGLVYDTFRGEAIYWGGDVTDQTYVWRWNGETWRRDDTTEFVGFHLETAAAYDERRHSVVMFGGNYVGTDAAVRGLSARTFERVLADEPIFLRQPSLVDVPGTHRLFLRLVAAGAPPLRYEWQRDGVTLAEGFPYAGTTNDTLVVDRVLAADTGIYRCIVRGRCGEAVSRGIDLRGNPSAEGLVLTLASPPVPGQPGLSLTWSGAGVVLEKAPVPAGPWEAVAGATSPYAPALTGPGAFFRLRGP